MEKITLYNHFHNGDIFLSRIIVDVLSEKFEIDYYHNYTPKLFKDIPNVKEFNGIPYSSGDTDLENRIVNTWIGQNDYKYTSIEPQGSGHKNHLELLKDICNYYKIQLDNTKNYLPKVYYENIENYSIIKDKMLLLKNKFKLIVLVCDGIVLSNQCNNFNFGPVIEFLGNNNKEVLFLLTNNSHTQTDNIFQIDDEFINERPNLLEISIISSFCDIIVGRASGPYIFTLTENNLYDESKTIISINDNIVDGLFYFESKCKMVWSPDFDEKNIINLIQNEINLK
jgi:hypothetical protein